VPIGPLALLVAVDMLPDITRTVGNVAMDVVVAALDRGRTGAKPSPAWAANAGDQAQFIQDRPAGVLPVLVVAARPAVRSRSWRTGQRGRGPRGS
jgi:hypothetical protein